MVTLDELKDKLASNARLIGLDLGTKRIGIAICDDKRKIASPYKTIEYKNMDSLVRILKPKGVITTQVGSQDKKPKQVDSWLNVFNQNFGNAKLSRVYIPSFDCAWNFSSSINH